MNVLLVTDVPTPYRNHAFETMAELFPEHGLDFHVAFMAERSKWRTWAFDARDLHYPHTVFWGLHPMLRGVDLHLNPSLLLHLRHGRPDIVIVGGWGSPTHALAAWCASANALRLLWSESHLGSVTRTSAVARWLKSKIIHRYDGFVVPQRRSMELLFSLDPDAETKPYVVYPNTIDSAVFRSPHTPETRSNTRRKLGLPENVQMWLCVSRLSEEKGLEPFLRQMSNTPNVRVVVAGEGPERQTLQNVIHAHNVPALLLGEQTQNEIARLYAAADLFVLPSLRDASPLSVIEACAAGLPLFVSSRIGNVDDVLERGVNGFMYDADSPARNRDVLHEISTLPFSTLKSMGERSYAIYDDKFDSRQCVRRLAEGLVAMRRAKVITSQTRDNGSR